MTGNNAKNVPLQKAQGGRRMVVSVGRVQGDITFTSEQIREIEKLMGASRRKREALMAWLRRTSRKLVAPGVREELVEMDKSLKHWYEVVDMDVEENVEDCPPPNTGPPQEPPPGAAGPGPAPPAPAPPAPNPPAPKPPAAETPAPPVAGRSKRGAAAEADRTMEESFEKGDLSFSKEEKKDFKKPSTKRKASIARNERQNEKKKRKMNETGEKKKRKKKKKMTTVIVSKPLVYCTNVPGILESVRVARGLSKEETMVRIGIDAGQGSLKVVANVFSK
jgi:hypothetical protein